MSDNPTPATSTKADVINGAFDEWFDGKSTPRWLDPASWTIKRLEAAGFAVVAAGRLAVLEAENARLRATGNELADHLDGWSIEQFEERYTKEGPCAGCYEAVVAWRAAAGEQHP